MPPCMASPHVCCPWSCSPVDISRLVSSSSLYVVPVWSSGTVVKFSYSRPFIFAVFIAVTASTKNTVLLNLHALPCYSRLASRMAAPIFGLLGLLFLAAAAIVNASMGVRDPPFPNQYKAYAKGKNHLPTPVRTKAWSFAYIERDDTDLRIMADVSGPGTAALPWDRMAAQALLHCPRIAWQPRPHTCMAQISASCVYAAMRMPY